MPHLPTRKSNRVPMRRERETDLNSEPLMPGARQVRGIRDQALQAARLLPQLLRPRPPWFRPDLPDRKFARPATG